jgi:hypothetical protein
MIRNSSRIVGLLASETRNKTLWARDSVAKQALDTAVQARESAQAMVEQAAARLANGRLRPTAMARAGSGSSRRSPRDKAQTVFRVLA